MKYLFTIILLTTSIQVSFSQACGIYRVKYVGEIKAKNIEVTSVKLPTTAYLHGLEKRNSNVAFLEYDIDSNNIEIEMSSHMSCHLHGNAKKYLELYQSKHKTLSIILMVQKDDKEVEIPIELDWEKVTITAIDDERFGNLLEINLNTIEI